jgi:CubicO group peptidase (beta-lactamase class C family)
VTQEITSPELVGMSTKRLNRIKPAMQRYVHEKSIAGISTMIARKGKIIHFEHVGQMDKESNKAMSDDTIFRIYSMTKPIVCTALMILFEQGKFQLTDPVAKFIPRFAKLKVLELDENGKNKEVALHIPVTILHLFTHTSGLTYDFLEDSPVSELYRQARILNNAKRSLEDFINDLTQLPLAFQPGTRWHYSVSIDVVARLIEVLSGQSLQSFLKENLFDPLGMIDTDFYIPPEKQDRIASMYGLPDMAGRNMTFGKIFEAWSQGFHQKIDVSGTYPSNNQNSFARGGHGLFSTATDYMHFAQMLLNKGEFSGTRILSRKTVELMHLNHLAANLLPFTIVLPPFNGYGFGLGSRVLMNVAENVKPGSIGEFGWAGAANTYYWVDPQEELIGIFMSQSMVEFEIPSSDFRVLTYQAIAD